LPDLFAQEAVKERSLQVYTGEELAIRLQLEQLERDGLEVASDARASRIHNLLGSSKWEISPGGSSKSVGLQDGVPTCPKSLVVIPLVASDSTLLGVVEWACDWKITPEDAKLLDCFAVFAALSLEKSQLEDLAKHGVVESNMRQWISEPERLGYQIPQRLRLEPERLEQVFTVNFDAPLFDGTGHFKVIWAIFDSFGLLERFKITNEKMFKFITAISQSYKKVPYHNWRHAVDVTQFVQYSVKTVKLQEVLTVNELFGLCVAAVCHDANHDGFTNVFNEKAETPLGILFKNQSVMETHHCSVAIDIISKADTNIFESLSPEEFKAMWTMIIALILSTDMAKHFSFLKDVSALLDEGPLDFTIPKHRFVAMNLILKCADISNVARPFEMANKWCDVLCEEFFRQGDLEMTSGMEYTSPLNDRAHLDKPKSQIGFYTFVCLPLYECAARAMPGLQVNVDQVRSNLAVWKAAQES
jgi:hypothetical protein